MYVFVDETHTFGATGREISGHVLNAVALPDVRRQRGALFGHTGETDVVPVFSSTLDLADGLRRRLWSQTQQKSTAHLSIPEQQPHG